MPTPLRKRCPLQKRYPYVYALTHTEVLLLYGPRAEMPPLYRNATPVRKHGSYAETLPLIFSTL